ncbi:MAG: hypothetical protein IJX24_06190 [Oscillospiraceae bacterium]|nr:hypothetical protein [Oscillospiraceae bacterium]
MKKIIAVSAALLCMLSFSACDIIEKAELESPVSSEADINENADKESDSESEKNDAEDIVEEEDDADLSDSEVNSDENTQEKSDTDSDTADTQDEQDSDKSIEEIGQELFDKSCETQWKYLLGCPYETDYNDMNGYAVRIVGVNSLDEIEAEYCEVFAQPSDELYEKYFEADGGIYCYDGGRGSNISYISTDLVLEICDDEKAVFTAVSHYADPQTGESEEDVENTFVIIYTDGQWKTSEFTLPY